MKGKYAARAENRRAAELEARITDLREVVAKERSDSRARILELEGEIRRIRADQLAEAGRLAEAEVARLLKKANDERKSRGLSDEIAGNMVYQHDKFFMNACKFVSMTHGIPPLDALMWVMTWATGEDFFGWTRLDMLMKIGLPHDGWVAAQLGKVNPSERKRIMKENRALGRPATVTLDHAEERWLEDPSRWTDRIHPKYKPKWYNPNWYRKQSVEIVGDRERSDEVGENDVDAPLVGGGDE